LVSAATAWEFTIKAGIGKQMMWQHGPPADLLDSFIDRLGATRLPSFMQHLYRPIYTFLITLEPVLRLKP